LNKPKKPYKFAIDGDPIVYRGASCGEQVYYQWELFDKNDNVEDRSDRFAKAKDAKDWIVSELWGDDPAKVGWIRRAWTEIKPLEEALKATRYAVDEYIRTCKKFCREGKEPLLKGFLTPSGEKNKNIKGIEDQYQFNRIGKEKPHYIEECRQYLLDNYPWVVMAKEGFEADTHVIALAEKWGEDGCLLSIDKDLNQAEGTWLIDTNALEYKREVIFTTLVGELYEVVSAKGKVAIKGNGFMFLCYQAVVGDVSDGYKGLPLMGEKTAYRLLKDCTNKEECVKVTIAMYDEKFKAGYVCKKLKDVVNDGKLAFPKIKGEYTFLSWDGKVCSPTRNELINLHFFVAYQERSSTDYFDIRGFDDNLAN